MLLSINQIPRFLSLSHFLFSFFFNKFPSAVFYLIDDFLSIVRSPQKPPSQATKKSTNVCTYTRDEFHTLILFLIVRIKSEFQVVLDHHRFGCYIGVSHP